MKRTRFLSFFLLAAAVCFAAMPASAQETMKITETILHGK